MKSVQQNAKKIRGGARLLLIAAVASGLTLIAQVLGYYLGMTYQQSQYLVQTIDVVVFASFVAAGAGLYLAFMGIADELEAAA